jgi:hypothetical protein
MGPPKCRVGTFATEHYLILVHSAVHRLAMFPEMGFSACAPPPRSTRAPPRSILCPYPSSRRSILLLHTGQHMVGSVMPTSLPASPSPTPGLVWTGAPHQRLGPLTLFNRTFGGY